MVSKTKRTGKLGNHKNTRGGRNASDLFAGARRNYAAGGYKDKMKMTALTRAKNGRHIDRKHKAAAARAKRSTK